MRLDPGSLYDYEARARQVLPHQTWPRPSLHGRGIPPTHLQVRALKAYPRNEALLPYYA
jgi:hypothetical protein